MPIQGREFFFLLREGIKHGIAEGLTTILIYCIITLALGRSGGFGISTFCLFVVMIKQAVIWVFVTHDLLLMIVIKEDQFRQGILDYEPYRGVVYHRNGKIGGVGSGELPTCEL